MPRKDARNVNPGPSNDPRDKLLAALNWATGKWRSSKDYGRAPMYFDACLAWHEALSADDKETVLTLADVMARAHKGAAEGMAASLPPAPRCPL
jgi:hypothetical protein